MKLIRMLISNLAEGGCGPHCHPKLHCYCNQCHGG